tara:strand:- start:1473 stop:3488 length:2016 start_codon:yes stop_codon:yes gene_type:complete
MKFDCLVWYSKLALPPEDNDFVSNFLEQGLKIISDEIKSKNQNKYELNIEYLYIDKGENGLKQLFNKLDNYKDYFFTHGHAITKYHKPILEHLSNKKFYYFHHDLSLETDVNKNMFCLAKVDRNSKLNLIDDEIENFRGKKIYFLHNELRLSDQILDKYKNHDNFIDFSFKSIEDENDIRLKVKDIFSKLKSDELIIVDINLKYFREIFSYLEEINSKNKVINTFGSLENRLKKVSFDLIQAGGNITIPSLSIQDLINKIYPEGISANQKTLLSDSAFRLEIPLLISQALNKCDDADLEKKDPDKIRFAILSFDGERDIFLGKRLQYGFDKEGKNIFKENYCYTFPSSLQTKDFVVPKILYPKQYKTVNNLIKKFSVIYSYIDVERVTNIDIKSRYWTAEFYLDIVSDLKDPIDELIFNNLSALNDKFSYKLIFEKLEKNGYNTKRYYIVANFDFLPLADNYPFDWQNLYIAQTLKNNEKHILQPIPQELIDQDFDVNEWDIENSFSGIKYKKNKLFKDTDLKKTADISSENRVGWILKRKNTATLLKIGIPMFFLIFLVYYSIFLDYDNASQSIGILTTTFLSAIALYFSVEKPEPKKMTIIDLIFVWFYIVNGITVVSCGLTSFFSENIFYTTSAMLKVIVPISLISMAIYLYKRIQRNREDILLDRDI